MARRLSGDALQRDGALPEGWVGREICRNCGGAILVDGADHRTANVPHRRTCRTCGDEYGTTRAPLYPPREEYSTVRAGFYSSSEHRQTNGKPIA
jgi:hypothetical protein